MSWHAARGWCMENGGDLASILSADEQNFTMELVRQNNESILLTVNKHAGILCILKWSSYKHINYKVLKNYKDSNMPKIIFY